VSALARNLSTLRLPEKSLPFIGYRPSKKRIPEIEKDRVKAFRRKGASSD